MSDDFSANGIINAVTPAPGDTALGLLASTSRRARVYFFDLSVGGTPVDNVIQWLLRRFTADGTRTAVTPRPLDPNFPVALLGAGENYTVEPTYVAGNEYFDRYVHQRAGYTWNAHPGKGIWIPAVTGEGIGFTPIHAAYVGSAQAIVQWEE